MSIRTASVTRTATALVAAIGLAAIGCAHTSHADHHAKVSKDIVDTAVSAGDFTTLAAALQAAGLVDTLKGEGPFTVFAPTDAAFAKLPAGTVDDLLKPENRAQLQAILTYHVVPGKVTSDEVVKNGALQTVQGQTLNVQLRQGDVYVDDAKVTAVDVAASNGVIHVIDTVVLPRAEG